MMQPGHDICSGVAELITAVDEQPQRHRDVIDNDLPQTGRAQGDYGDAVRVGRVGLAAWPVENTLARADSFAGMSTTVSPSATSRWATCRPMPLQPSTAHTRSVCS